MTLTLSLLRHAKSSWSDPSHSDFDRPLADRGRAAAPVMGRHMRETGVLPDLVFCSPARRTRETLALVLEAAAITQTVRHEDRLYLATSEIMLAILRRLDGPPAADLSPAGRPPAHVMIVGHNPGLHELAMDVAHDGPGALRRELIRKLPTAGLVVIDLALGRWADVAPGTGTLAAFAMPKRLMAE